MLVPIPNSYVGGSTFSCSQRPNIDLYDQDGEFVSGFCHTPYDGATGGAVSDLACGALFVQNQKMYLLAIRHDYLYLYRIHWHGPARRSANIYVRQVVVQNMHTVHRESGGAGNSGWPENYNSVNLFANKQGQLFMMCGTQAQEDSVLDVWRVDGTWSGGSKDDPQSWDETPTFWKVASGGHRLAPYQYGEDIRKGLFYEGVAIARFDDHHMRIYLLPNDFKHLSCVSIKKGRLCTDVYYYDFRWS